MPSSLLVASRLCKNYGPRRILDNVSFSLETGERLALMGPSGSGKSTLLNCLGGIDKPDTGTIRFLDQDIAALPDESLANLRRKAIGTIFQFFHLLPTLTAYENAALPLLLNRLPSRQISKRIDQLLNEVGLVHRRDAFPSQMSGGELQRVAIARALATEPKLLLADEPTGNLDRATGNLVLDLLRALCERHQTALIMVTHDPEAVRICQRVLHFQDGKVIEEVSR